MYQRIETDVLPRLFAMKPTPGHRLRGWAIGCATGEEAYSLAMLMLEVSQRCAVGPRMQVFASDLAEDMLERARDGVYPREVVGSVSEERLARFFVREGSNYAVRREVRDLVVFAMHNLFRDPPFSHLDLIICRDLLHELQPAVRRGVQAMLYYALEPHGVLIVSPTDSIDAQLFDAVDANVGLFRRKPGPPQPLALIPSTMPAAEFGDGWLRAPAGAASRDFAAVHAELIEPYVPPSVMVDAHNEVVYYSSHANRYVRIPGGELTHNLVKLVREPLASELNAALQISLRNDTPWRSEPLVVQTALGPRRVILRVESIDPNGAAPLRLVVFDELDEAWLETRLVHDRDPAETVAKLGAELGEVQRRLRLLVDDGAHPTSSEAELQPSSESLRRVLHDVDLSKQDLRALNEELASLSSENQRRIDELAQLSDGLQHLLESTGIATLFLDRELRIIRFTPQLAELFNLRHIDRGRSITDVTHGLRYDELEADAQRVLEHVTTVEREIASVDDRWFLARMLPYRRAHRIDGVVITMVDITDRKKIEDELRDADRRKDEFLALLAHELRNPLAPISSGIEVLKLAGNDARVVEQISATMSRQTKLLVRLVDDLLEVSRITGGRLQLRKTQLELAHVIRDAVAGVQSSIDRAGQTLTVEGPEEPIPLEGDAARLTQVLDEPAQQCNPLYGAGRRNRTRCKTRWRDGRHMRERHRHRHSARRARPRLRVVLPGRRSAYGAHERGPRHRTDARADAGRDARRFDYRAQRRHRSGQRVRSAAADFQAFGRRVGGERAHRGAAERPPGAHRGRQR